MKKEININILLLGFSMKEKPNLKRIIKLTNHNNVNFIPIDFEDLILDLKESNNNILLKLKEVIESNLNKILLFEEKTIFLISKELSYEKLLKNLLAILIKNKVNQSIILTDNNISNTFIESPLSLVNIHKTILAETMKYEINKENKNYFLNQNKLLFEKVCLGINNLAIENDIQNINTNNNDNTTHVDINVINSKTEEINLYKYKNEVIEKTSSRKKVAIIIDKNLALLKYIKFKLDIYGLEPFIYSDINMLNKSFKGNVVDYFFISTDFYSDLEHIIYHYKKALPNNDIKVILLTEKEGLINKIKSKLINVDDELITPINEKKLKEIVS